MLNLWGKCVILGYISMYLVLYTDMDIEHQEQAYMKYLIDDLEEYAQSDYYPFHMPGHKRKSLAFPNPYEIDITEIDGFDNLHHATGMIKEAEVRGAELYHSKRCFFLVNGSTCGLLAAISAATRRGDKVLVARNCHKAVYHALYMNELQAEYLYPSITKNGIQGQITVEQVQESLYENPDAVAVILTSPTYEGIVSDVAKIAEVCHEHGIPLIVDEAHGAHFGFGGGFPENAVKLGADAVIMSLHKTLPSFTQTALLHLTSDLIDEKRVERYLSIYEFTILYFYGGNGFVYPADCRTWAAAFCRLQEASDGFLWENSRFKIPACHAGGRSGHRGSI